MLSATPPAVQAAPARGSLRPTRLCAAAAPTVPPAWPGRALLPDGAKPSWGSGPKPVSLIGSTGSIGTQTLDICAEFPNDYKVVALSAGNNVALLAEQVRGGGRAPPRGSR